jgi:gliding motility-associated-like protein
VNVFEPEIYTLTVSKVNDSATCYGSATLYVDINPHPPIYVPNVFSPNGDGKNDLFQVYGNNIMTVDMKIFNRWGELVYETNNQLAGWDGTYKGQMQNPGVFTYALKVTFLDNTQIEKNGTVTLLR